MKAIFQIKVLRNQLSLWYNLVFTFIHEVFHEKLKKNNVCLMYTIEIIQSDWITLKKAGYRNIMQELNLKI